MKLVQKITMTAGLLAILGLVGSYQNFDNASLAPARGIASIEIPSSDIEIADDTVTLTESHTILPSIVETVGSVENFKLNSQLKKDGLASLPAIMIPKSHMKSMGLISGQRLEIEVNGNTKPVYAYTLSSNDAQGVNINLAAAKDLGAKIGDKIIVRLLSETPPRISEKKSSDWLVTD